MWADVLDNNPIIGVIILFGFLLLPILYNVSNTAKFHIKMIMYYLTMFFGSLIAVPASIPTYFQNRGGTNAFRSFNLVATWLDVEYEIRNPEYLEEDGSAVLVANHQSSIDVITMGKLWPDRCTCMMKKSLMYVPGFNLACILSNTIFVDRFNKDKAVEALNKATDTILNKNLKIWVFPEGTRFRGKGMLPFKKGAFNMAVNAQIPIVPIVVSYYGNFYSNKDKTFKNRGQVIVQVQKPVPTKGVSVLR